jgi:hypothetical protein
MEIGVLLHTRQIIRQEDAAKSFDQLWSDGARAEELGFDHIWLGDSVTVLDKARGDCLTTMAALAARTNKIRIGAVPMLPALRNPVLLAHALATLDVISKGRIILGVSVGPVRDYIQRQFAACGVPPQEKAGRLSESIEIMRRLWNETTITYDGRYFKLDDVGILPHPAQSRGYRSGSPRTKTIMDLSASGVWVTAGSRCRRRWRDLLRHGKRSINMPRSMAVRRNVRSALYTQLSIFRPIATGRETKVGNGWNVSSSSPRKSSVTTSPFSPRRKSACAC